MEALGKDLEFISWIKRDGSGVVPIGQGVDEVGHPEINDTSHMDNDKFKLTNLSLTYKTFIASGFNCFVVKLKDTVKW